jgi:hypothetical protein
MGGENEHAARCARDMYTVHAEKGLRSKKGGDSQCMPREAQLRHDRGTTLEQISADDDAAHLLCALFTH